MLTNAIPMAEYSIALRKRSSLSVAGRSSIRNGSHGAFIIGPACWVVSAEGLWAIISETTITVTRNTMNASIRGKRTALHISRTITQVKGHGSQVMDAQLRASVTAMVTRVSSSNLGSRWRSR